MNGRTESRQGSKASRKGKGNFEMAEGERMQLRSMVGKDKESNRGEAATHDGEGPDPIETITPTTTDHTQEWSDGLDDLDRAIRVS